MSRKVTFKLSGERLEAALKFANEMDLPLDQLAKNCLFLVLQQSYAAQERFDASNTIDAVITKNQKVFDRLALTDVGPATAPVLDPVPILRSYTYEDGFGGLYEYTATLEKSPSGEMEVTGIDTLGWDPKSDTVWRILEEQAMAEYLRGP